MTSEKVLDEKGKKERVRYLIISLFYLYFTVIYRVQRKSVLQPAIWASYS